MLAAKRSIGSLRAAARAQVVAAPPLPQKGAAARPLMSAVLLSSQRGQLERKTVKQLQVDLRERGLSSAGKKKDLVDRLLEAVSRGPGPSSSSAISSSITSKTTATTASFSTTARSAAHDAQGTKATADASRGANTSPAVVATDTVPVFSPSPVAAGSEPPTAGAANPSDSVTASPGLVVDKQQVEQIAQEAEAVPGGGIDMPSSVSSAMQTMHLPAVDVPTEDDIVMIPSPPDSYTNEPDRDPFVQPFTLHPSWLTPKVHAVSEAVQHFHHTGSANKIEDDSKAVTLEPQKVVEYLDKEAGIWQDMLANLGVRVQKKAKSAAAAVQAEGGAVLSMLEQQTGVKLPPLNAPIKGEDGEEGQAKFEFQDRPLTTDETRGLYTLGGILGLGFLLGTFGARKSGSKETTSAH